MQQAQQQVQQVQQQVHQQQQQQRPQRLQAQQPDVDQDAQPKAGRAQELKGAGTLREAEASVLCSSAGKAPAAGGSSSGSDGAALTAAGSTGQAIDSSAGQATDGSMGQATDGSTGQATDGSAGQATNGSTKQAIGGPSLQSGRQQAPSEDLVVSAAAAHEAGCSPVELQFAAGAIAGRVLQIIAAVAAAGVGPGSSGGPAGAVGVGTAADAAASSDAVARSGAGSASTSSRAAGDAAGGPDGGSAATRGTAAGSQQPAGDLLMGIWMGGVLTDQSLLPLLLQHGAYLTAATTRARGAEGTVAALPLPLPLPLLPVVKAWLRALLSHGALEHLATGWQDEVRVLLQQLQEVQRRAGAPEPCASCGGVLQSPMLCGGCRQVRYCSQECQRAHWREHRPQCKLWQAAGAAGGPAAE